jgi:hypothetical protein
VISRGCDGLAGWLKRDWLGGYRGGQWGAEGAVLHRKSAARFQVFVLRSTPMLCADAGALHDRQGLRHWHSTPPNLPAHLQHCAAAAVGRRRRCPTHLASPPQWLCNPALSPSESPLISQEDGLRPLAAPWRAAAEVQPPSRRPLAWRGRSGSRPGGVACP